MSFPNTFKEFIAEVKEDARPDQHPALDVMVGMFESYAMCKNQATLNLVLGMEGEPNQISLNQIEVVYRNLALSLGDDGTVYKAAIVSFIASIVTNAAFDEYVQWVEINVHRKLLAKGDNRTTEQLIRWWYSYSDAEMMIEDRDGGTIAFMIQDGVEPKTIQSIVEYWNDLEMDDALDNAQLEAFRNGIKEFYGVE